MRLTVNVPGNPETGTPRTRFDVISTSAGTIHIQKFIEHNDGGPPSLSVHMSMADAEAAHSVGEALIAAASRILRGD